MSRLQRQRRRARGRGGAHRILFLGLGVLVTGVAIGAIALVAWIVSVATSGPSLDARTPINLGATSRVYAADGQRLGFIQANELRLPIATKDIPQNIKDATVAVEDRRFYQHEGVDLEGVVRAAIKNLESGDEVQGGSTLTMQLVRNLYTGERDRTFKRKIREAKLAEDLENRHPGRRGKQWILNKYLNSVPYGTVGGQTALGIQAAARIFFDKSAADLRVHEAALLAGLPAGALPVQPVPGRREGPRPAQRRPPAHGRPGLHQAGDGRPHEGDGPRREVQPLLHRPPRGVLLRLRQAAAHRRPGHRPGRRAAWRTAHRHDDRPAHAEGGAQGDGRPARRSQPLGGGRHDRPAHRLHQGDGVVVALRRLEVQPRRPGPPTAGLDRSRRWC